MQRRSRRDERGDRCRNDEHGRERHATLPRAVMPLLVTVAALITALFAGRAVQPALNRPLMALRIDGALTHLSPAQIAVAAAVPCTRTFSMPI